ncbi:hypothetical protein ACFL2V_15675 [Pseudomonadota bacterium]
MGSFTHYGLGLFSVSELFSDQALSGFSISMPDGASMILDEVSYEQGFAASGVGIVSLPSSLLLLIMPAFFLIKRHISRQTES